MYVHTVYSVIDIALVDWCVCIYNVPAIPAVHVNIIEVILMYRVVVNAARSLAV